MTELSCVGCIDSDEHPVRGSSGPLVANCTAKIVHLVSGQPLPVGKQGEVRT
jgi:long-subunit acyl-CoA synthetase (AMP-forming)